MRAREPALRSGAVAEAALDDAAMEELGRVERAEPERALREAQRLAATAVARERPGEHVVAVDRRTLRSRGACERHGSFDANPVVDVEEGELEIHVHAAAALEPGDRRDEIVLPLRPGVIAGGAEQVTEIANVRRQWKHLGCTTREPDGASDVSARGLDLRERIERRRVSVSHAQRRGVLTSRGTETPVVPVELPELCVGPRKRFGLSNARVHRELHRLLGPGDIAEQLARIRDASIGAHARFQRDHPVEGVERLFVAAELDERVTDDAVTVRGRG